LQAHGISAGEEIPMKYVFRIALVVAVIIVGWRILAPEVTNVIFRDEVQDSAAQLGYRTGVAPLNSDEEIRNIVIRKAAQHHIELNPKQVTVQRKGVGEYATWYVAVDYTVQVNLLLFSLPLHFTPTSQGGMFGGIGASEPASPPSPAKVVPKPSQPRTDRSRDPQPTKELKEIPESLKRPQ
jgi:hypothetical protein